MSSEPSPFAPSTLPPRAWWRWLKRIGFTLAGLGGVFIALLLTGMLRIFTIPTSSMAPTIQAKDGVVMEAITYLFRAPQRGDVVAYRTAGLPEVRAGEVFCKRVVGLPGEKLRIANGRLYVNGTPVSIANAAGEIPFVSQPVMHFLAQPTDEVTVPAGAYFVIGDNTRLSADSREHGAVPAQNILGRMILRTAPWSRRGWIK